jgi:hypothetical protein
VIEDDFSDIQELRLKKIAFLHANGALGYRMNGVLSMVAKRMNDVREAEGLRPGRLADRARRKTAERLVDAEAKLDREIERTIDKRSLRDQWEDFDSISDEDQREIEGLLGYS